MQLVMRQSSHHGTLTEKIATRRRVIGRRTAGCSAGGWATTTSTTPTWDAVFSASFIGRMLPELSALTSLGGTGRETNGCGAPATRLGATPDAGNVDELRLLAQK
jgi:hypothetical protein